MSSDNLMAALEAFNEEKPTQSEAIVEIPSNIPEKSVSVVEITKQEDVVDNHSDNRDLDNALDTTVDNTVDSLDVAPVAPITEQTNSEPILTESEFFDAIDYSIESVEKNTAEEITENDTENKEDAPFDYGAALG